MIELAEYVPQAVPLPLLNTAAVRLLWEQYRAQVRVEQVHVNPRRPGAEHQWLLTNLGWVGYLPLDGGQGLWLVPKTPIANLLAIYEWVYGLEAMHFQEGEAQVGSLAGFYNSLAGLLAAGVLRRIHQGLHRSYRQKIERLPFVRGRLLADVQLAAAVRCQWSEAGPDNLENRLLLAALYHILYSDLCRGEVLAKVRAAYRLLTGEVSLTSCSPADCARVVYHRLNRDYRLLHSLARFFLDGRGPSHFRGERPVRPFLLEMARLFEQFVAAWLAAHLPAAWTLRAQQAIPLDEQAQRAVVPDILLYNGDGDLSFVLDTKYKADAAPANEDIYQIVTYAHVLGCKDALLVYPQKPTRPLDVTVNGIRVRSVGFVLGEALPEAGARFLQELNIGEEG